MWKRKFSGATVIFVLARYGMMLSLILQTVGGFRWRGIMTDDVSEASTTATFYKQQGSTSHI